MGSSDAVLTMVRQALQQWKSSKAQLIATVEAQAKKFAGLDIDIDEMLEDLGLLMSRIKGQVCTGALANLAT